jgi:membrane protein implicated in regulation of membrane protease activity
MGITKSQRKVRDFTSHPWPELSFFSFSLILLLHLLHLSLSLSLYLSVSLYVHLTLSVFFVCAWKRGEEREREMKGERKGKKRGRGEREECMREGEGYVDWNGLCLLLLDLHTYDDMKL